MKFHIYSDIKTHILIYIHVFYNDENKLFQNKHSLSMSLSYDHNIV